MVYKKAVNEIINNIKYLFKNKKIKTHFIVDYADITINNVKTLNPYKLQQKYLSQANEYQVEQQQYSHSLIPYGYVFVYLNKIRNSKNYQIEIIIKDNFGYLKPNSKIVDNISNYLKAIIKNILI